MFESSYLPNKDMSERDASKYKQLISLYNLFSTLSMIMINSASV